MPKLTPADTAQAVDRFMAALEHPHKPEIEALRQAICAVDPSIAEGVKWNAPSWRTTDYFATTHLRAKTGFGLILHLGAKARRPARDRRPGRPVEVAGQGPRAGRVRLRRRLHRQAAGLAGHHPAMDHPRLTA
jgi:hypothetical protein